MAAARATRAYLGRQESGLDLTIANPLPAARGFGTSTADLVGSIGATAAVLGATLSARDIVHLATSIEPSDSTMLFGLAVLSHRDGACWEVLGPAPDLALVVLDVGGVVDTLAYNAALDLARWSTQETAHAHALALLRAGLVRGDPRLIGRAATESALAHQNVVPGPAFPAALGLAERVGAYGVCIAHSGTALGLVLPSERGLVARVVAHARAVVPGVVDAWTTRLVGGGIRYHDHVTGRLVARV
ncbi:MAG: hypothetical protein NVSMB65_10380 [Chloroflexota bacterium]